uniref:Uncharacterized protein n=1 Tax=Trichobilharzia regenti TaxID=157069 RepID=A0AA85KHG7_TRIRE|nr:unnamed protein product [Trichobilharzia regenti]
MADLAGSEWRIAGEHEEDGNDEDTTLTNNTQQLAQITINGRNLKEVTSLTYLGRHNRKSEIRLHQCETGLEIFCILPQYKLKHTGFQHKCYASQSVISSIWVGNVYCASRRSSPTTSCKLLSATPTFAGSILKIELPVGSYTRKN